MLSINAFNEQGGTSVTPQYASLYRETGDIYLVASVLGHNDVNTTRKHYAAQEEERRRSARNVVRLRES